MPYTEKDYSALLNRLKESAEEKYKIFNESLMPGTTNSYGVRVPELRRIAREIIKDDWKGFLHVAAEDSHEERMLQGMVIASARCDIHRRLEYVKDFIPKINNWAICDVFCGDFKSAGKNQEAVAAFLQPYFASEQEFAVRFAVVMRMDYFVDERYIDETLRILEGISHQGYYAKMAAAWALSLCFIKFRDKTLDLIKKNTLDPVIQNKGIQKCRESYRVSREDKALLNGLKR